MMSKYELEDVVTRVFDGDDSLSIPGPGEIEEIEEGDFAKVVFVFDGGPKKERMWVKVTESSFPLFKGVLDNDSEYSASLKSGLELSFEAQNVVDIIVP